jgi:hypothetical protein
MELGWFLYVWYSKRKTDGKIAGLSGIPAFMESFSSDNIIVGKMIC